MLSAILEFIHNPTVQIVLIIANPIMGYIGGYFAGMSRVLRKQNKASRERVLKMIEDRKNGVVKSDETGNPCWYD